MKLAAFAAGAVLAASASLVLAEEPPAWAYPVNPAKPEPDNGVPRTLPGSKASYTLSQVRDQFLAPDWHPEEHAPMPPVVAHGRKPDVMACGFCHRADGPGGPENAAIAGLPYNYIVQQLADYKSGARRTSVEKRGPQANMIRTAKGATDEEVREAAKYFASLKPRQTIRVVETTNVPSTYVANWFLAVKPGGGDGEPIAGRIIEVPEDTEQFELRDTHSRFVAYVPVGSVAKGEFLVKTGGGRTQPCETCHGADLRGTADIPPIAGRSPSYVMRQLWDVKHGARNGKGAEQMKPVIASLATEDMTNIAAYLATLTP